jgi:hypothetical protein
MEMNGQLREPVVLSPKKLPTVPTVLEVEWTQGSV